MAGIETGLILFGILFLLTGVFEIINGETDLVNGVFFTVGLFGVVPVFIGKKLVFDWS